MTAGAIVGLLVGLFTLASTLGGLAWSIFKIGGFVSRIEAAASRVEKIETRLDKIPLIEQMAVTAHERIARLEGRHDSTRVHAIRAEAISTHGE